MSDNVEIMKVDHAELTHKISKLNAFIHSDLTYKSLNDLEQVKIVKQVAHMEAYAQVLNSRIWTAAGVT